MCSQKILGLGQEVFIIRGTFFKWGKGLSTSMFILGEGSICTSQADTGSLSRVVLITAD